jgi:hypothetical protein
MAKVTPDDRESGERGATGFASQKPLCRYSIYPDIVIGWLAVLSTIAITCLKEAKTFGSARLLPIVAAVDTFRKFRSRICLADMTRGHRPIFSFAIFRPVSRRR